MATVSESKMLMVEGKRKLEGKIKISGAKNSVLPLMAASLLTEKTVTLTNVPNITDVEMMKETLEGYGVKVVWDRPNKTLKLTAGGNLRSSPGNRAGVNIRAAFLVLGPLLARKRGETVSVYRSGGCSIEEGGRPVDFHIQAMETLGATLIEENGVIKGRVGREGLQSGKTITFIKSSVGATQNAMMAASLVDGVTVIQNAAIEPEITKDLVEMLVKMGAEIAVERNVLIEEDITQSGIYGSIETWNVIAVRGRQTLQGATQAVMPDRIEFGTYAIAAAITNGKIVLEVPENMKRTMLEAIEDQLEKAGVKMENVKEDARRRQKSGIEISLQDGRINPVDIKTGPYPGFPTDLLPQWVTFMTQAQPQRRGSKSHTTVKERIFDKRFMYVNDLIRMGAEIEKTEDTEVSSLWEYRIKAKGGFASTAATSLNRKRVTAPDLRGGAALALAGLVAEGTTTVKEFAQIQRGYEDMVGKLKKCRGKLEVVDSARKGHYGGR